MKIVQDQTIYPGHQQQIDERNNYRKQKNSLAPTDLQKWFETNYRLMLVAPAPTAPSRNGDCRRQSRPIAAVDIGASATATVVAKSVWREDRQRIAGKIGAWAYFSFAKSNYKKLLEVGIFFFYHNISGVAKIQDLPNKLFQTVGVALTKVTLNKI